MNMLVTYQRPLAVKMKYMCQVPDVRNLSVPRTEGVLNRLPRSRISRVGVRVNLLMLKCSRQWIKELEHWKLYAMI